MKKIFTKSLLQYLPVAFLATAPLVTQAQAPDLDYFDTAVVAIGDLVEQLIPIVISLALLFFIWGLVQFIIASGDETAKEAGKRRMVWGIFALFIIVSVWGIVELLAEMTGVSVGGTIDIPSVDF